MNTKTKEYTSIQESNNFIDKVIQTDLREYPDITVHTRFPPEPNGYLHIGHAKSILLNFSLATQYKGICNLRFDDTNPDRENQEFINAIIEDVSWLLETDNFVIHYASDYFSTYLACARLLIDKGLAYVDFSSPEEVRLNRGTPTQQGIESTYRSTSIEENKRLFEKMVVGSYDDGECILRAKIDMAHPNIVMRDPPIYRIKKTSHPRQKDAWKIYPMYDFAHCLGDAMDNVTHSLCTLEFENNRPLYDWFLENTGHRRPFPKQTEFGRLSLNETVLSKRKLKRLVDEQKIDGWDDPRIYTLCGMRRRGFTPTGIRAFCKEIGTSRSNSQIAVQRLEECVRQELNMSATRVMCVLDPILLRITNYPEGQSEVFEVPNNPEDPSAGTHNVDFSGVLYIEREDGMVNAPKKYYRFSLGKEVRLKYAYYVTCTKIHQDENGDITSIEAVYDPQSRGGWTDDKRRVMGTVHWVSCQKARHCKVRKFNPLFTHEHPETLGEEFIDYLNKESIVLYEHSMIEEFAYKLADDVHLQFLRKGYCYKDKVQSTDSCTMYNITVSLKDSLKNRIFMS